MVAHRSPAQNTELDRRTAAVVAAAKTHGKNLSAIARETGLDRATARRALRRAGEAKPKPVSGGAVDVRKTHRFDLPDKGKVKRYIFTAAQNNTKVHGQFLKNLEAFAAKFDAEIHVSRFTYNKNAYDQSEVKPDTEDEFENLWYDPKLAEYFSDDRVQVAPGLVWCGEMNILPTAVRPLSGFETYTGRNSGIFPHAKIAMESIVAMAGEGTKFNYTTGAVTQRNYIQKKAGLKAEFHHAYGALLVEVDETGTWFCRQLNATDDGTFHDLDVKVCRGRVTKGHRVEAINWGDRHAAEADPVVSKLAWGKGGMLDTLRARKQFDNDLYSMRSRGHHDAKNCHRLYQRFIEGEDGVEQELAKTAKAMHASDRKWCRSFVVDSNHHDHLDRWLRESDYRFDPVNAAFFLAAQRAVYDHIRMKDKNFLLLEWALRRAGCPRRTRFLRPDESFVICPQHGGGIECGMHGHIGPNGSRGNIRALGKLGRKANVGHSHSAGIMDGVYQAGTSSLLRLDYNRGPSSWSHSHIVTYANGKRCIVTMYKGKWRA